MLLQERMKAYHFSPSERIVIDYILDKQELIRDYSTKMIADETYTSPSLLIRISKKLDYSGWSELKRAFLNEVQYLNNHFKTIDPNYPFTDNDNITTIAAKIGQLQIESIEDTLSLIHHDALQKAIQIMRESDEIRLFSINNLNYIGEEFVYKLNRINMRASIFPNSDNMLQHAAMTTSNQCAVCISYSGETPNLLKTVALAKDNGVPIIAITSIGNNSLSRLSDVVLHVSTREKTYSKISAFSSLQSMHTILDILFSCLFSLNYNENLEYKLAIASKVENNRIIDNSILEEETSDL